MRIQSGKKYCQRNTNERLRFRLFCKRLSRRRPDIERKKKFYDSGRAYTGQPRQIRQY